MALVGDVWDWFTTTSRFRGSSGVPHRLYEHVQLSFWTMAIAVVVSLPLALWLGHLRRGGALAVNLANLGRAVPSYGLLVFGVQIWGIGLISGLPKAGLFALVLLAVPPLVTNAYVGMSGVPDDVRDSARGMGMTGWQSFREVELPIALPFVMTGLRISTLQVIATATIAAFVGVGGLGRYIVDGYAVQDYPQVFAGALLVALLALLAEFGLTAIERIVTSQGLRHQR
ncbi:MAG: ABC transporter permease [Acidimicrobiia bacterium]